MPTTNTREQWLNSAADTLIEVVLTDKVIENKDRPPFRISVAPMGGKTLGLCHKREASQDGHNEIFTAANCDDSVKVLEILTHELIHAYDDCQSGHKNFFARAARKAGLEGKLTATTAGASLREVLTMIVDIQGEIPHAELKIKPKGKGRNNNRLVCTFCDFKANVSKLQADKVNDNDGRQCPSCDSDSDFFTVDYA